MYDFEYHNIIDYWSEEYKIFMSMEERAKLIELYEQALIRFNDDLDFNKLCMNLCMKKYLMEKYGALNIWEKIFTRAGMN